MFGKMYSKVDFIGNLSIQQIYIEYLLCAKHCTVVTGMEMRLHGLCPPRTPRLVRKVYKQMIPN